MATNQGPTLRPELERDTKCPMRAVFVGGAGRSGTTMLGDLLGAHPRHVCTPETSYKTMLVRRGWGSADGDLRSGLDVVSRHLKFRDLGVPLPELTQPSLRGLFEPVVRAYGERLAKAGADVWIDHTPSNLSIGHILLAEFPSSHVIHLVRDGRAVAASAIPLDWGPNSVISVAREWTLYAALGLALEANYPGRVHRIRYEDLVREPSSTLRRICDLTGMEFCDAMVHGGGLQVPTRQADQFALVGKPPDPSRIDAWRTKLDRREIEIFEAETSSLLTLLGYDLMFEGRTRYLSPIATLLVDARDVVRDRTINWWRRRKRMK
jgi:hypothetical protein